MKVQHLAFLALVAHVAVARSSSEEQLLKRGLSELGDPLGEVVRAANLGPSDIVHSAFQPHTHRSTADGAAASSSLPQQSWSLKGKATAEPAAASSLKHAAVMAGEDGRRKYVRPVWDESMEPMWGRFIWTDEEKANLQSPDDVLRAKLWQRVFSRKSRAIIRGEEQSEWYSFDPVDLKSGDPDRVRALQKRVWERIARLNRARPDVNSLGWAAWKIKMDVELTLRAQARREAARLRAIARGNQHVPPPEPMMVRVDSRRRKLTRPRKKIAGFTPQDDADFHSRDEDRLAQLRNRLKARIGTARRHLKRGEDASWESKLKADLVSRAACNLLESYPSEEIAKQIPNALVAVAGMTLAEVDESIISKLATLVQTARVASAAEGAHGTSSAQLAQFSDALQQPTAHLSQTHPASSTSQRFSAQDSVRLDPGSSSRPFREEQRPPGQVEPGSRATDNSVGIEAMSHHQAPGHSQQPPSPDHSHTNWSHIFAELGQEDLAFLHGQAALSDRTTST